MCHQVIETKETSPLCHYFKSIKTLSQQLAAQSDEENTQAMPSSNSSQNRQKRVLLEKYLSRLNHANADIKQLFEENDASMRKIKTVALRSSSMMKKQLQFVQ